MQVYQPPSSCLTPSSRSLPLNQSFSSVNTLHSDWSRPNQNFYSGAQYHSNGISKEQELNSGWQNYQQHHHQQQHQQHHHQQCNHQQHNHQQHNHQQHNHQQHSHQQLTQYSSGDGNYTTYSQPFQPSQTSNSNWQQPHSSYTNVSESGYRSGRRGSQPNPYTAGQGFDGTYHCQFSVWKARRRPYCLRGPLTLHSFFRLECCTICAQRVQFFGAWE